MANPACRPSNTPTPKKMDATSTPTATATETDAPTQTCVPQSNVIGVIVVPGNNTGGGGGAEGGDSSGGFQAVTTPRYIDLCIIHPLPSDTPEPTNTNTPTVTYTPSNTHTPTPPSPMPSTYVPTSTSTQPAVCMLSIPGAPFAYRAPIYGNPYEGLDIPPGVTTIDAYAADPLTNTLWFHVSQPANFTSNDPDIRWVGWIHVYSSDQNSAGYVTVNSRRIIVPRTIDYAAIGTNLTIRAINSCVAGLYDASTQSSRN